MIDGVTSPPFSAAGMAPILSGMRPDVLLHSVSISMICN
jgi:hypothetical protein